ncbi:hypothetical protein [Fibrobacter sp.]|uniref:hypothetical protein n=1 Tax=Fibrobacter sp. TaxID=35828 RepID=UPI0025BA5746|nr:hypothetical protein [Fibrobacter sp.]MBR3073610.1 hypothetical protein [Fibrobacter sp.]
MNSIDTQYGIKLLIGQWRADEIKNALTKILTTENVMKDVLNSGEVETLQLLLNLLKNPEYKEKEP